MYIDSITQKNNWEPTYVWTTKFFNEHPDLKVGAEVGVAAGQHIKAIMEETKIEKMYGIDAYMPESWNVNVPVTSFDEIYNEVNSMLSSYGDRVELIRKKSTEAAPDFEDGTLDFVFIDAGHDYENCYNDINYWHNRVRKGGYVMGHDWEHVNFPGVMQAVTDHYGDDVDGVPEPTHVWYHKVK